MFISNEEKRYLFDQIKQLTAIAETVNKLESQVIFWQAKVRALEGKVDTMHQVAQKKPTKPKTAAQKAKQREYMKAYHARKKAEQLAKVKK